MGNGGHGISIGAGPGKILPGFNVLNCTIGRPADGEGNIISGNKLDGIYIGGDEFGPCNITIQNNLIGTNETVTDMIPNGRNGIELDGTRPIMIGGPAPHEGNYIGGNGLSGIVLTGVAEFYTDNVGIHGNSIGVGAQQTYIGNNLDEVTIDADSRNNTVGEPDPDPNDDQFPGNVIAYNERSGVAVIGNLTRQNPIRGNYIYSNGGLGIDLGADGPSIHHDPNLAEGPNLWLHAPIFTAIQIVNGDTVVDATLDALTNAPFTVDFFANKSCDPLGYGEGKFPLFSQSVTYDQHDNIHIVIPGEHHNLSMTTTDLFGNTSEISTCGVPYIVNTTNDLPDDNPGDGVAKTGNLLPGGRLECSLRAAIMEANTTTDSQTILFDIPGAAPFSIVLTNFLPPLTAPAAIDATSQQGYAFGHPVVKVDGVNLG
ncbi:MAG: CSLREA domain-containing protein [bacterium]|nr:CSLREA domain-containing protein [bacterium]